jgi:neurotransmitter:Na+ symporter, NSS family
MVELARSRPQWASTAGFILASLGAAIGLGNIWRFSYVVGDNGGGAFLMVYALIMLLIGLPMLLAELAIGRRAQREAASAFASLADRHIWQIAGLPGVLVSFVILTYYAVIAGWALKYFVAFASGAYPLRAILSTDYFQAFISSAIEPLVWQAAILLAAAIIVTGGIEYGIERANKVMMPMLAAIILLLVAHSFTLPGATQGYVYLFKPDWTKLTDAKLYLAALGQAFFSLGLAMGALVTYGSYLQARQPLPLAGIAIVGGDTLFALAAAMVIFPAVFSFGMTPAQGPGLAFIVLPEIFVRMSGGATVAIAFFGLLVLAAITSLVALIEVPVAFCMAKWGWNRQKAVLACTGMAFILGVPSALSFGPLAGITIAGKPLLDAIDFFASNVVLPLSGLGIAVFAGWHWTPANPVGFRSRIVARLWRFSIRFLAPAAILLIFLRSISLL